MTPPSPWGDDAVLPTVIQGGMGVGVSAWRLASAVAADGQLGVVSGTALDVVMTRRLQDGDPDGAMRRAFAAFPDPGVVARVLDTYFRPDGRPRGAPYRPLPRLSLRQNREAQQLMALANFAEVWLAKEGHDGLVGINFLEKVQMATPAATYGAILAGVDYVLMGAGIPREIPQLLDDLAAGRPVRLPVHVDGAAPESHHVELDPGALLDVEVPPLTRPVFLAIISADALAAYLARDAHIRPDGFVIEGPSAGGHNAPPRGRAVLDDLGQPVFGPRDLADVSKVAAVGLPFWLAGSYDTPEAVVAAREAGAQGVQAGTVFALSKESGLDPDLLRQALDRLRADTLEVRTDPAASPTGFPFKVAQLPGTLSDARVLANRERLCDLGALRTPYLRESGAVGYRCPAEPVELFVSKGGDAAETVGRVCLCNALTADIGLEQTRPDGYTERALVTLGASLVGVRRLLALHPCGWSAREALRWLLEGVTAQLPTISMAISSASVGA